MRGAFAIEVLVAEAAEHQAPFDDQAVTGDLCAPPRQEFFQDHARIARKGAGVLECLRQIVRAGHAAHAFAAGGVRWLDHEREADFRGGLARALQRRDCRELRSAEAVCHEEGAERGLVGQAVRGVHAQAGGDRERP